MQLTESTAKCQPLGCKLKLQINKDSQQFCSSILPVGTDRKGVHELMILNQKIRVNRNYHSALVFDGAGNKAKENLFFVTCWLCRVYQTKKKLALTKWLAIVSIEANYLACPCWLHLSSTILRPRLARCGQWKPAPIFWLARALAWLPWAKTKQTPSAN
jgi:hypothetical protein